MPADRDALRVVARDLLPIWRQRERDMAPRLQSILASASNESLQERKMPFVRSAYIRFITSSVPRSPPRVAELRVVGHGKAVFLRGV